MPEPALPDLGDVVGEFTTMFEPRQPRVQNIARIAELVNGTVIEPHGRLSINEIVGPRTREKGFVVAGVIANGHFSEGVGGGVSQFATTLFNAAFFAGLDLVTYQSHSLYIDRYPYGREATLSHPSPDLVIGNPSPYPVLVIASVTDTSVTVQLFSTRWARGEQSSQSESPYGRCTRVVTGRTRTFVDGHVEKDAVFATYRPREGVNCRGGQA